MLAINHVRAALLSSCSRRLYTSDSGAVQRLKSPKRGGQNLSLRYRRLEQSLRGKLALQKDIDTRAQEDALPAPNDLSARAPAFDTSRSFHGFEIPQRPKPPESDECCMSGCAVCVYDLYDESVTAYNDSIATLRTTLASAGIAEASWPDSLHPGRGADQGKKSAVLSAFEELEQALQKKRRGDTQ
ncbi:oxidoreductase-like protein [Mycena belliarum]|uniref:Oxidoreductase-like protein n=1 Tax=Mycena belliarum TaxID=1033014 RepID=A0AAD6XY99_9AGAR|nr:oxidoreductase-like protein [Mycena belliae]